MTLRGSIRQAHSHHQYDGPRRWFRVAVHDTTDVLVEAARRFRPGNDWTGTAGCVHPVPQRFRVGPDGDMHEVETRGYAGLIRLARGHITTEVVGHEAVHAALVVYRMDIASPVDLGDGVDDAEEHLAYIAGDLSARLADWLHDHDAWTP